MLGPQLALGQRPFAGVTPPPLTPKGKRRKARSASGRGADRQRMSVLILCQAFQRAKSLGKEGLVELLLLRPA